MRKSTKTATYLKEMIHYPDLSEQYASRATFSTDAWEQARIRLTQLLRPHHIQHLVTYYASIRRITVNLADMNASTKAKTREQKAKAVNIRKKRRVLLSSQATYVAWLEGKKSGAWERSTSEPCQTTLKPRKRKPKRPPAMIRQKTTAKIPTRKQLAQHSRGIETNPRSR